MKPTIARLTLASAVAIALCIPAPAQQEQQEETPLEVSKRLQQEVIELPPPYREKIAREGGQIMELSLQDAVRLALLHNLDIAIENFSEDLTSERIIQARGFYDPELVFRVGFNDLTFPTTRELDAGQGQAVFASETFSYRTQLNQNLPTGGSITAFWDSNRELTNDQFARFNPTFEGQLHLEISQPLWRGFRQTQTRRQIKLRNLDKEIDDLDFERRVADVIQQVQDRYWELVFAIKNYETRRQGMKLAIQQHENNQKRVNIGVSAPIEITSSRAEVALREQEMISSEVQIINAQNRMKQLMSEDPKASIWSLILYPTAQPTTPDITTSLEGAIDTALANRPEIKRVNTLLEQDAVNQKFYRKEKKPAVNLFLTYDSRSATGGMGAGLGEALQEAFLFDATSWAVFAEVRIPLRNRTNEALLAQAVLNEQRNLSQIKNEQQAIIVEVRNAYEGLRTQAKRLKSARLARELSEEQLRGENKRFSAGLSTNFQVLRFQRDLTNAEAQELRALIDYEQAVTALYRATHQIVEQSQISFARDQNQR